MLCIYPTFLSAGAASDRLGFYGVRDGARSRNICSHSAVLYQLSYSHHIEEEIDLTGYINSTPQVPSVHTFCLNAYLFGGGGG